MVVMPQLPRICRRVDDSGCPLQDPRMRPSGPRPTSLGRPESLAGSGCHAIQSGTGRSACAARLRFVARA